MSPRLPRGERTSGGLYLAPPRRQPRVTSGTGIRLSRGSNGRRVQTARQGRVRGPARKRRTSRETPQAALRRTAMECARTLIIDQLQVVKNQLVNNLEAGNRDFPRLEKLFQEVRDLQQAADCLGGNSPGVKRYLGTVIEGYKNDPADNDFQRGYKALAVEMLKVAEDYGWE